MYRVLRGFWGPICGQKDLFSLLFYSMYMYLRLICRFCLNVFNVFVDVLITAMQTDTYFYILHVYNICIVLLCFYLVQGSI